jgi:hypothetical protein
VAQTVEGQLPAVAALVAILSEAVVAVAVAVAVAVVAPALLPVPAAAADWAVPSMTQF